MPMIEVESSYRFLYLRRDEDELYVGYDYDGMKALIIEKGDEYCYLIVDLKGEKHMLLISPKLVSLKKDTDKKKIATDLYLDYCQQLRNEREILCLFEQVNT